jgi:hypothetical protein
MIVAINIRIISDGGGVHSKKVSVVRIDRFAPISLILLIQELLSFVLYRVVLLRKVNSQLARGCLGVNVFLIAIR